jgi:hypothetical protein
MARQTSAWSSKGSAHNEPSQVKFESPRNGAIPHPRSATKMCKKDLRFQKLILVQKRPEGLQACLQPKSCTVGNCYYTVPLSSLFAVNDLNVQ